LSVIAPPSFLGVDDGDGAAVVARHVVADADGDQLDRRAGLDLVDDVAQVPLEIVAGVDRQRRIVDRRAVGDHHQDLALLGRPSRRLCAQASASPSMFSLSSPSRIIRPRLRRARRHGASAAL
jgi:hypothetical protein